MRYTDTELLLDTPRPVTLPKKVTYLLVRARTNPKIVRWAFWLFIATFPIESIDLGVMRGAASLTRLVGLLFFSTCLLYPKACFRRPPQALWWFAGYGFIYVLNGLVIPQQFVSPFLVQLQTFIQLLVLCWIGSTLLQEEKFARHTVLAFSIATLFLATGMLLGLPRFSQTWGGERLSAAGFDPNGIAPIMALGAQAFIGFGIEQTRRAVGMRVTFIALSLLPLTAMVYTGSRGGILACVTGLALYALPYRRAKRKMTAILVATIAIVGVGYIVANNQTTLSRFEKSYETGNTAKRDKIFAASLEMFAEKPLLGWGAVIWGYELGSRAGRRANELGTHNLFLYLLVEVGLLGAAPFFIGLGSCVRAAWTARACSLEFIPLVWLITMLVDSMSIDTLRAKVLWLTLMLSLAAEAATIKRFKKKNIMSSVILQHVNQN